ncbi:hypothetical protein RHS01_09455 [Rhizoctonia solani]|uniref:Chitinase n=1 Tax=Rhizoctonia solani TaxID=456999 RepID=A0A8H7M0Z0_9AGAM|nr:hypothetical protein RHS01_09455 [Rhizoctonia solani]
MKLRLVAGYLALVTVASLFNSVYGDDYSCSAAKPCSNGACCGVSGYCGYGPTYCGTGCQSNCTATAECGQYAAVPGTKCPLNVCCSQYGFCGTTPEFCDVGQKCQSGCGQPSKPSGKGYSASQRVIGYFESWSGTRPCDQWDPTMISATQITHLNFAFALIDSSNHITPSAPSDVSLYKQAMSLKDSNPDLKIFISIGGWAFNHNGIFVCEPSDFYFFLHSVYEDLWFDGVDIDWEYPVDDLRGGVPADKANLNSLLKEFRAAIDSSGVAYGLTITTPSSYYYLRHFDVAEISKWIDWFNHMTYDLHGVWDKDSKFLGPNENVPSNKVALGLGFYGDRSSSLVLLAQSLVNDRFRRDIGPAKAGACTGAAGVLSYSEIQAAINGTSGKRKRASANVVWDKTAAVKYAYWTTNGFLMMMGTRLNRLGGMLIWAIDQDTGNYDAINALGSTVGVQNTKLAIKANGQKNVKEIDNLQHPSRWAGDPPNCRTKGYCNSDEEEVTRDNTVVDPPWPLCCTPKKTEAADPLKLCKWFGTAPGCSDGFCNDPAYPVQVTTGSGLGGNGQYCAFNRKVLCCPSSNTYLDCEWVGGAACISTKCPSGKVSIASDAEGGGEMKAAKAMGIVSGAACANHPAVIKDTYFLKPTSCDKSVFGIWGKFWVPDDKCCKSSKRALSPAHFGIDERSLVPRAGCGASSGMLLAISGNLHNHTTGFVNPTPINPANGVVALSVFELLRSSMIRDALQVGKSQVIYLRNLTLGSKCGTMLSPRRTQLVKLDVTAFVAEYVRTTNCEPRSSIGHGLMNSWFLSDSKNVGAWLYLINAIPTLVAHSHPFLRNLGYGLDPQPSEPDHIQAWRYGIPSIVVTRLGTYLAGPSRRVARSGPNDRTLTNLLGASLSHFLAMSNEWFPP